MLPFMLLPLHLLLLKQVPAGTPLHVRLTTAVGSYDGKAGMAVRAVLIAPVTDGEQVLIPAGSTLSGSIQRVNKVGYGIRRETALLALDFDQVALPDGSAIPIGTKVRQVDNGREKVAKDGSI